MRRTREDRLARRRVARELGGFLGIRRLLHFVLLGLISGCSHPTETATARPKGEPSTITIATASDLQTVLPRIVEKYESTSRGSRIVLTFGASGQLAEQIKAGAPYDLFLSANETFVTNLAKQGLVVPDSVRPYAVGSLVLAVRKEAKELDEIQGLIGLTKPGVKTIAMANPETAPYGAAAREALRQAGLWEKVEAKLVYAENVRQALRFVESGNADAGFVSFATTENADVRVILVDRSLHAPIVQTLGILTTSTNRKEAEEFSEFLIKGQGRQILEDHGFQKPPDAPE
jgi:molybdate transport system substrate-binding protein